MILGSKHVGAILVFQCEILCKCICWLIIKVIQRNARCNNNDLNIQFLYTVTKTCITVAVFVCWRPRVVLKLQGCEVKHAMTPNYRPVSYPQRRMSPLRKTTNFRHTCTGYRTNLLYNFSHIFNLELLCFISTSNSSDRDRFCYA